MSPTLKIKGRLTCMAIVLVTVCSLTICMLFWENISLMKTSSAIDKEKARLLVDDNFYEVKGHAIRSEKDLEDIPKPKFLLHDKIPNMIIKPWEAKSDNDNDQDTENHNQPHLQQEQQQQEKQEAGDEEEALPPLQHNHYNEDPILEYNPLNHPECQNALIDKENINKEELLSKHLNKIKCEAPKNRNKMYDRSDNKKWLPKIWSREFISALTSNNCYEPRTPIRTVSEFYDDKLYSNEDNSIPVFYHIPKCGSSSTAAMTSELFNFSIHWRPGPENMHETIYTKCGFAFIRDPIQRFISAYYTINKKIYREMKHEFISAPDRIPDRFKGRLNFLMIMGEPQRFEAFMKDLFREPDWWGIEDPLKHIASQTYFLSNWYGSDINFFGRVEHYGDHWKLLMNYPGCEWFKNLYIDHPEIDLENYQVSHALFHYGTMGLSMYKSRKDRQKEYIEALGMNQMLEKMYGMNKRKYNISEDDVLPPAYYFITEEMYNQIVDFYYQDFVCFGYKPDFKEFRKYVESKKNPFTITL